MARRAGRRGSRRNQGPYLTPAAGPIEERWDELLSNAIEVGIGLDAFWNVTPRELRLLARAFFRKERREGLFVAWHVAALSRAESLPSLEDLLADPPTEEEMAAERERAARDFAAAIAVHERAVK